MIGEQKVLEGRRDTFANLEPELEPGAIAGARKQRERSTRLAEGAKHVNTI